MAWLNAVPPDGFGQFVSVREMQILFGVQRRTIQTWITIAARDKEQSLRIWYHPDRGKAWERRLLWPMLHVHIEDVIAMADKRGVGLTEEIKADIRARLEGT